MNLIKSPVILVVIPTYKREKMLRQTISSVVTQRYHNWRIIVSDSGNTLTSNELRKWFPEFNDRIVLWSYGREIPAYEHWQLLLKPIASQDADYFVLLGDDDILSNRCLMEVAKNSGDEVIACNVSVFYQTEMSLRWIENNKDDISIAVEYLNFFEYCISKHGCSIINNNLRYKKEIQFPLIETHVSAYFISIEILKSVLAKYGSLWAEPFSDVGIGLAIYEAKKIKLILDPLVVIRRHESIGMGYINKNRHKLAATHRYHFTESVPDVVCFNVFSVISYEKMMKCVDPNIKLSVNAFFYFICIRQILGDGLNKLSVIDFFKTLKHATLNKNAWLSMLDACMIVVRKIFSKKDSIRNISCSSMNECLVIINSGLLDHSCDE